MLYEVEGIAGKCYTPSPSVESCLSSFVLWQPWASLIPLGLKHYETRSWKTNYRGKLLICSAAASSGQHKEYLKICSEIELPPWSDFPHGCAIAICDLVDCIEMTPEFIEQQSKTEILCGDWQVGRYAWKLENIELITEPFAVKGKQGLFNISVDKPLTELVKPKTEVNVPKSSDCWYTPPHIIDKVIEVLGEIDLDPCADDGLHIHARSHFTAADDGLSREWHGRVFMNPPYSCPGVWMNKLQSEVAAGRVTEAIALVPAATDTNWLNPVLKSQPVCFWKGRIRFLDVSYEPKLPARQSHCLIYWGSNSQQFKKVFDEVGIVKDIDRWNPSDFGDVPYKADGNQLTIFYDIEEPPEPDDYQTISDYEQAWTQWELKNQRKDKTMTFQFSQTQAIMHQIAQLQQQLNQLTPSLAPYQECEQKAENLRQQVAEYGHEMNAKGIPQDDISNWAKSLYSAVTGEELNLNSVATIAFQNEEITKLKAELQKADKCLNNKAKEHNEALTKITNMTAGSLRISEKLRLLQQERDQLKEKLENLAAQSDTAAVETLQKENTSLIAKIQELDEKHIDAEESVPMPEKVKQQIDQLKQLREELKNLAAKSDITAVETLQKENASLIAEIQELIPDAEALKQETELKTAVQHENQVGKGRDFMEQIRSKVGMNNITWTSITRICLGDVSILGEMLLSARTKYQKELVDRIPSLMADYISETGDVIDLEWVGDGLRSKAEALLEAKKSLPYHSKDWVRTVTGEIWQVKSFDGEWLSVTANNKIVSLHKSEVELVQQEAVA
jgi:phage N-6-adenine-methyltransferase